METKTELNAFIAFREATFNHKKYWLILIFMVLDIESKPQQTSIQQSRLLLLLLWNLFCQRKVFAEGLQFITSSPVPSCPGVSVPPSCPLSLLISGWITFLRLAATMAELFDGGSAVLQVFPLWWGTWASDALHLLYYPPPPTLRQ